MKPPLDFFSLFNLFGALNGFFFAAVIWKIKRGNRRTNRIAALLLVNMALITTAAFFSYTGYFRIYPKLQKLFSPFLFLMGPLLYIYVRSLLQSDTFGNLSRVLHFFPAVLNGIYNIPFYLKSNAEKVAMLSLGITPAVRVIRILALLQFLVYLWIILREIQKYRIRASEQYASLSRLKVQWIAHLGFAFGTVLLLNIIPELQIPAFSELSTVWEALLTLFLGYKGLTQPVLFLSRDLSSDSKNNDQPLIPEHQQCEYVERISCFMREEKPFLNPELSLNLLAEGLGLPTSHCSFIINRHWRMNFFHFVNHSRVEEFKRRVRDGEQAITILEMAMAVGFNSKSTFNAVFKQYEGVTPSQYIKAKQPGKSPT